VKKAFVNGVEIGQGAVQFELDRLVRFYESHGVSKDEIEKSRPILEEKALEQAIGARLLVDRAQQLDVPVTAADVDAEIEKVVAQVGGTDNYRKALEAQGLSEEKFRRELERGARVNKLVAQACASVPEPTEDEVVAYWESNRAAWSEGGARTLVDVHDQLKDLLRHAARGRAMDAFIAELREKAEIRYE
jgi:hypothetical protein